MLLNVQEAARKTGISPHTIRYYTNIGLIPSLKHDAHGNRVFDGEALNWLICTRFLRESGMPISDIKHYFALCQEGDSSLMERTEILRKLQEKTEGEIAALEQKAECIREKVNLCEKAIMGDAVDDSNPIYWKIEL